ncbi:MAG: YaeQ family protein, partial [Rhodoferax sp.]|nr:YaeQ family protein [Rhodoferax sp.]
DKPLAKACAKADAVVLYCFGHAAEVWWKGIENKLTRLRNLSVYRMPSEAAQGLQVLAQRSMQLQATVQDGSLMLADDRSAVEITPLRWK